MYACLSLSFNNCVVLIIFFSFYIMLWISFTKTQYVSLIHVVSQYHSLVFSNVYPLVLLIRVVVHYKKCELRPQVEKKAMFTIGAFILNIQVIIFFVIWMLFQTWPILFPKIPYYSNVLDCNGHSANNYVRPVCLSSDAPRNDRRDFIKTRCDLAVYLFMTSLLQRITFMNKIWLPKIENI